MAPVLLLQSVRYQYVNPYVTVEAVRGVDYAFEQGRMYALQGASGSGKTTLLSLMAGIDLPTEGEVLFEGVSTRKMDLNRHRREHVAVIYQGYNLLPLLTVAENVMYPMELNRVKPKDAKKQAHALIERVGLSADTFARFPSMLSGGQQQRVAIARALGSPAKVILADEPTGNLDAENSRTVIDLLLNLAHTQHYCVIVVTHDPAVAERADVVLYMQDGRLTEPT